ncbi:MAG: DUF4129 domain-containing protein [Saprospiraceae bacterium]|nr:DUF4129 domain-containing protein [Saprospiraceae bacterium]
MRPWSIARMLPFLMVWIVTVFTIPAFSQDVVDKTEFSDLSKELDYSDTRTAMLVRDRKERTAEDPAHSIDRGWYNSLGIFQWVAFALIALVLGFIVFTLFQKPKDVETSQPALEDLAVEDVHDIAADRLYEQALLDGDFRLALRMRFIKVMQLLNGRSMIDWKPEKTNRQYVLEMRGNPLGRLFREITHIYEWVWYGNTALNQEDFERYDRPFVHFFESVRP